MGCHRSLQVLGGKATNLILADPQQYSKIKYSVCLTLAPHKH